MAPAATNEFIDQVHNQNHPFWEQLASVMPGTQDAVGAAAGHQANYRHEAAYKLILNHEAVLRDICNPSPMQNVIGVELTQKDLKRVPAQYAQHVDQFLRELTRRLMGRVAVPEEKAQPMSEQSVAGRRRRSSSPRACTPARPRNLGGSPTWTPAPRWRCARSSRSSVARDGACRGGTATCPLSQPCRFELCSPSSAGGSSCAAVPYCCETSRAHRCDGWCDSAVWGLRMALGRVQRRVAPEIVRPWTRCEPG